MIGRYAAPAAIRSSSAEADPVNGRISNESPIGKAVLGHKAGDVVEVTTPGGMLKLKVTSIGK